MALKIECIKDDNADVVLRARLRGDTRLIGEPGLMGDVSLLINFNDVMEFDLGRSSSACFACSC